LRFFFSSRRRHTRCYRDWSSDVCSSDLAKARGGDDQLIGGVRGGPKHGAKRYTIAEGNHRIRVWNKLRSGARIGHRDEVCLRRKIGRASCRERVESGVGEVEGKRTVEQR